MPITADMTDTAAAGAEAAAGAAAAEDSAPAAVGAKRPRGDPSEEEESPTQDQVRHRPRFLDPDRVELHCADFNWAEVAAAHLGRLAAEAAECEPWGAEAEAAFQAAQGREWERHYQAHRGKFFPVKNYVPRAFPLLAAPREPGAPPRVVVDAGCGAGGASLGLMRRWPTDRYVCFDISPTAVEELRGDEVFRACGDAKAAVWDVCADSDHLPPEVAAVRGAADVVLLLFTLSACAPGHMQRAVRRLAQLLRPGGALLFRDYGACDHTQVRFHDKRAKEGDGRLFRCAPVAAAAAAPAPAAAGASAGAAGADAPPAGPSGVVYRRGDGTQAYYYTTEEARRLAEQAGLAVAECVYHCNEVRNRKNGKAMRKVFVNAVFRRPADAG